MLTQKPSSQALAKKEKQHYLNPPPKIFQHSIYHNPELIIETPPVLIPYNLSRRNARPTTRTRSGVVNGNHLLSPSPIDSISVTALAKNCFTRHSCLSLWRTPTIYHDLLHSMLELDKITVYNPLFVGGFDFRDGLL